MSAFEIGIFAWICVSVLALLVGPVCNVLQDAFVFRDGSGHGRRLTDFYDVGRSAGLTYQQSSDEFYLRHMLAHIRRTASDGVAVSVDKANWLICIDNAKRDAFDKIERERPELLQAFRSALSGLSYGHILYPAEASLVDRLLGSETQIAAPTPDHVAALRVVRPG